jgi:hypothetical protein
VYQQSFAGLPTRSAENKKYRVSDFQEASATIEDSYQRIEQREGVEVKRPNLCKAGLKKAEAMGAKVRKK